MSLATQITSFATRIGTEFKTIRATLGSLSSLTTTNKTTFVDAINEVKSAVSGAGATINDTTASTTNVYSSSKTASAIASAAATVKSDILGGAGSAYDTLAELKALLDTSDAADDTALAALVTADSNRVRFDAAQTLTDAQKVTATANAGALSLLLAGDPTTDFAAAFVSALT